MSMSGILFVIAMTSAAYFASGGMWVVATICFILAGVSEAIAYIAYIRLKRRVKKLDEALLEFCKWTKSLPLSEIITGEGCEKED